MMDSGNTKGTEVLEPGVWKNPKTHATPVESLFLTDACCMEVYVFKILHQDRKEIHCKVLESPESTRTHASQVRTRDVEDSILY